VPPLGPNLFPRGDFEEWQAGVPAGWTLAPGRGSCDADERVVATGRRSLRLRLPAGRGAVSLRSKPVPIETGRYLVRFMLRVEGLSRGEKYEGGQAGLLLEWQDAQDRLLAREYFALSYIAMPLAYRDRIVAAPAGATALRLVVELTGGERMPLDSTAWFDDVAVCRYTPAVGIGEKAFSEWSVSDGHHVLRTPDAPGWGYLAGVEPGQGVETVQGRRERDSRALFGASLHTVPGVPAGHVYHSAYTTEQPPGLYRVLVRARIPATPLRKPDATVLNVDVLHSTTGVRGGRPILAGDFARPGEYQDFAFDVVKPSTGWLCYRVTTPGGEVESWLDLVRVVQLARFRDPDLLAWYPGIAGAIGAAARPAAPGTRRVLLVMGLLGDVYRCEEAFGRLGWSAGVARQSVTLSGAALVGYPADAAGLASNRMVAFANATAEALGPEQRFALRRFVEAGGGLLLLGGKSAFGNGGIRDSFLEDLLPVTPEASRFDIAANRAALADGPASAPWGVALGERLVSPYLHRATARPAAQVVARAGREPFVVAGTAGRGRVVCLLGTPYGEAPKGRTRFTDWDGYPAWLDAVLGWLANDATAVGTGEAATKGAIR
jgi:hypothetical protein